MLYKFLETNRAAILSLSEEKTLKLAGILPSSTKLKEGLPLFFDQLVKILKAKNPQTVNSEVLEAAAIHGKELLNLGYTLSHVVHAYGAMCQAITEFAVNKKIKIETQEFNDLNQSLDIAIAAAVSEFEFHSVHRAHEKEVHRLGFLVHELRNALSSASVAQGMIKAGIVGAGGSTARALEENLVRMGSLIDRSLSEIRMRSDPEILSEKFYLHDLVDQIVTTAKFEAAAKNQVVSSDVGSDFDMESDRQLLLSAIANFVQNAIKYSKNGGNILISATKEKNDRIGIKVKDECGGLPADRVDSLFKPFVKGGVDQSGMGLGLTISQRAISLMNGNVSVQNSPGNGCSFVIDMPRVYVTADPATSVSGKDSVQPPFRKKD